MAIDLAFADTIALGGTVFPVKGVAQGNAISEFEIGLKLGSASYDTRTQAFYVTLGDFSGGMGHRRMDVRDPKENTFWDYVVGVPAADTRRANHITLPPFQSTEDFPLPNQQHDVRLAHPTYPFLNLNGIYHFGYGNHILQMVDGKNWSDVPIAWGAHAADASYIQAFALYAPTAAGGGSVVYAAVNQFYGTATDYLWSQTDGVTWLQSIPTISKHLGDVVFWDNKILGAAVNLVIFGIITGQGITNVDATSWNIDDPNDAQPVAALFSAPIRFVGIASAPWGEPSVYFIGQGQGGESLWVMDFFARKCYPIKTGLEIRINDGKMYQGEITLTDGWSVFSYHPGRQTITSIGLPRLSGIPPTLQNPRKALSFLIPDNEYLYALAYGPYASQSADHIYSYQLMCYNGKGWHQIGETVAIAPDFGAIAAYIWAQSADWDGGEFPRRLHVFGATQPGPPIDATEQLKIVTYKLPGVSHVPVYGISHFGASGALITGWIDGGFADIDGVLLKMTIDALHLSSTETVKIEYQLNNDEDSEWFNTYDSAGVAALFTNTVRTVYFRQVNPLQGTQWRTVRFRITLARGTDDTKTPEIKALILAYIKKPYFRSTWTFTLDIDRMLEDAAFLIDGSPATMGGVWAKLQSLWNTQELLDLTIPTMESTTLHVLLNDVPISFDDFRTSVAGHGTVMVKCLEPINRA